MGAMTPWIRKLFLVLCILKSSAASADIAISGYTGIGVGQLNEEQTLSLVTLPFSGHVDYLMVVNDWLAITLGASNHRWEVSYQKADINYQGTYTAVGAGTSLVIRTDDSFQFHLNLESMNSAQLVVKSVASSSINGQEFKHSTLSTYTGSSGFLMRLSFISEETGKQFANDERLRTGITIDILQQNYNNRKVSIVTNDSSKGTSSLNELTGSFSMLGVSLSLVLGFVF